LLRNFRLGLLLLALASSLQSNLYFARVAKSQPFVMTRDIPL